MRQHTPPTRLTRLHGLKAAETLDFCVDGLAGEPVYADGSPFLRLASGARTQTMAQTIAIGATHKMAYTPAVTSTSRLARVCCLRA